MLYSQTALGGAFKVSPVLHSACTLQVRQRPPRVRVQNRAFCLANMQEVWKPVPGYEGLYEVSNQGRVRSFRRGANGKIRVPTQSVNGHLYVTLGRGVNKTVHSLVLATFVGPRPIGQECCHNDGNPSNNCLSNLRWDSHRENARDIFRHLASKNQKLTPEAVRHIKSVLAANQSKGVLTQLARQYGVTVGAVSCIKRGKTYDYPLA